MTQQEKELRHYIFNTPRHALPGIVTLCFFLLVTLIIAQEGDAAFTLAFAATGVLITLPMFLLAFIMPLRTRDAVLAAHADHLSEVVADFAAARDIPGLCRIGDRWLFGPDRCMIIDLTTTRGVSLQSEIYTRPDKEMHLHTRYVCRIGEETLCKVGPMETRLKLRELVTLLHGKCPIEKEVYEYCVLWDKERNAPKLDQPNKERKLNL